MLPASYRSDGLSNLMENRSPPCSKGAQMKNIFSLTILSILLISLTLACPVLACDPAQVQGQVLFSNLNPDGCWWTSEGTLKSGPKQPTRFTLKSDSVVTLIQNLHFVSGEGKQPRPGTIALRDGHGKLYGPWQTSGQWQNTGSPFERSRNGSGNWNVCFYGSMGKLPAGTYEVVDSHPASWNNNPKSNNTGFTIVKGFPDPDTNRPTPLLTLTVNIYAPGVVLSSPQSQQVKVGAPARFTLSVQPGYVLSLSCPARLVSGGIGQQGGIIVYEVPALQTNTTCKVYPRKVN